MNLSTYQSSPRYTFQPPVREMSSLKVPGPGSYEAPESHVRAHTMTSRRELKQKVEGPGPGTHEQKTSMGKGPHYSMSMPLSARGNRNPGPGSYEAKPSIGDGPKYSVYLPRNDPKSKVPGPGAYDHANFTKLDQTPKWTLTGSHRQKEVRHDEVPGPGTHMRKTAIGQGPKYSHGLPRQDKVSVTPGPGEYGGMYTTFHQ